MKYSLTLIIREETGKPPSQEAEIFREFSIGEIEQICSRLLRVTESLIERSADPHLLIDEMNAEPNYPFANTIPDDNLYEKTFLRPPPRPDETFGRESKTKEEKQ